LFCAVDGDIWAGTELGGVTRCHTGRFTTYTRRDGLPSNESSGLRATAAAPSGCWLMDSLPNVMRLRDDLSSQHREKTGIRSP
jgi:hypothetical protein